MNRIISSVACFDKQNGSIISYIKKTYIIILTIFAQTNQSFESSFSHHSYLQRNRKHRTDHSSCSGQELSAGCSYCR